MLRIEDPCPGLRLIGLDRAAKRNAIGVEMTWALRDAMWELISRPDIRAVVFHGLGGHFCTGMDLKDFFDGSDRDAASLRLARAATEEWRCHLVRQLPQRVYTAIEGYCLGGAMPIVAASHHVVAHAGAQFGLPELNFGFVPGGQIIKAVGQVVPRKALSYMALSGKLIDARLAQRWGLVHQVVAQDPLTQVVNEARQSLSRAAVGPG
ncbi:MAG: enoyl-CoA hydratase/isomerase family protein [Alphaproteobacteria bacterium]|nr:enoyl-CoA hydratase/isomerase family protein [Alphaproteobacteria bacterium]